MTTPDSVEYEAHAVVQKWSPEQMEEIKAEHGDRHFEGEELEALGIQPAEVTTDVEALGGS